MKRLLGYLVAALIATAPYASIAYADEIYDWSNSAANNNSAPPDGFPENMNYSDVNDAARELMAVVARFRDAIDGTNQTSGTQPAYTLSSGQSLAAAAGHVHVWVAHATSTGNVTLNVDSAGAKNVVDATGSQLGSGAIVQNGVYMTVETASNHRIIGALAATPIVGSTGSTDNAVLRADGTGGSTAQATSITVDDSDNVAGVGTLDVGDTSTTLSGSSGTLSVEGNEVYRAGGTDVPVTDGGTGASTASAAFTALKQAATTSATGVVEEATDAEVRASTNAKFIDAGHLSSAAAAVSLTDAATVAVDWSSGINFSLTLTTDRILGNPTNEVAGQWRTIEVGSDGGPDELTCGTEYEVCPTLDDVSTTNSYLVHIYCLGAGRFRAYADTGGDPS